jgi:hypothetical protein
LRIVEKSLSSKIDPSMGLERVFTYTDEMDNGSTGCAEKPKKGK